MTVDGAWLGVQRLAQKPHSTDVLEAAARRGVVWLDTADVYGPTPGDAERLLRPWAAQFRICTKVGLVRDGRAWRPDGRPGHLLDAAERSRERLGVGCLDLCLWHAPDPRTPVASSARALARVQQRGIARAVGVANLTAGQLREVAGHVSLAALQVEVSPVHHEAVRSGVIEVARALGIPVLAHRPFGGEKLAAKVLSTEAVAGVARRHGVSAAAVVLAWLRDLGMCPVPGPTRVEHVEDLLERLELDDVDRAALDEGTEAGVQLRLPRHERRPAGDGPEVVLIAGTPGAGKTRRVRAYPDHVRLNRDERGGTLDNLLRPLSEALGRGRSVVLDNTYPTRARRNAVVETAWRHQASVRCEWMDVADGDAERNVVIRILDLLGRLPEPDEIAALNRKNPSVLPPRALHRFRQQVEPPHEEEGYARLDVIPFARDPGEGHPAWLVDPVALERHPDLLRGAIADGARVLVLGFAPGADRTRWIATTEARAAERGLDVVADVCTHPAGPPVCWCRKPLPGLAVVLARRAGADLDRATVLVSSSADRALAARLGARVLQRG